MPLLSAKNLAIIDTATPGCQAVGHLARATWTPWLAQISSSRRTRSLGIRSDETITWPTL
jgi:hypothetical protein